MTNNANNDFERKVKSSLEGYEASFDSADWNDLENRLQSLPQHAPAFKWRFSMNAVAVVVACAALAFLVYKMTSPAKNDAASNKPAPEVVTPVQVTSAPVQQTNRAKVNSSEPKAETATEEMKQTPEPVVAETTLAAPAPTSAMAVYEQQKTSSASYRQMRADKNVATVDPIKPEVLDPETQKVRIFPDMLDPKKGVIYNTKEKTGTEPVQTEVNVGWNDYVIYPPASGSKTDSSHHAVATDTHAQPASGTKTRTERKSIFSRKPKSEKTAEKKEDVVTTPASTDKAATANTPDPAPAKPDTLKKTKLKNPKYKEDHSMLDPY
jgi:hypothetical protein